MITKTDLFVQGEFITSIADIRAAKTPLVGRCWRRSSDRCWSARR